MNAWSELKVVPGAYPVLQGTSNRPDRPSPSPLFVGVAHNKHGEGEGDEVVSRTGFQLSSASADGAANSDTR